MNIHRFCKEFNYKKRRGRKGLGAVFFPGWNYSSAGFIVV